MKSFEKTYTFAAPLHDVWQAFVNPPDIEAWSGEQADMSEHEGADFSLWDGDIRGINKTVERQKKLVQEWYGGNWEQPSRVMFEFEDNGHGTTVKLTHTNIPENDFKAIKEGWDHSYMEPLKEYIEGKT